MAESKLIVTGSRRVVRLLLELQLVKLLEPTESFPQYTDSFAIRTFPSPNISTETTQTGSI
jgi:hypothetical protein